MKSARGRHSLNLADELPPGRGGGGGGGAVLGSEPGAKGPIDMGTIQFGLGLIDASSNFGTVMGCA